MATIKIDNREPDLLPTELSYLGYEVEYERLAAGDFEGKYIIGEIKRNGTANDFFNSIIDKRVFNQPKKMLQTGKKVFMIVAGDPADERWMLPPVIGTMISLMMDFKIQLIQVQNREAIIAYTIDRLMKKDTKAIVEPVDYGRIENYTRKREVKLQKNSYLEMLRCIEGVGLKKALLIKKYVPSMVELVQKKESEIKGIPSIGPKIASNIYHALRGEN